MIRENRRHPWTGMVSASSSSVHVSHIPSFKLSFPGEKTTHLNIHHSAQPTPDSKSLATINRTDNEALFTQSVSRLINPVCVFVGRDEREGDNSC